MKCQECGINDAILECDICSECAPNEAQNDGATCENCEAQIAISLAPYGNSFMAVFSFPYFCGGLDTHLYYQKNIGVRKKTQINLPLGF